MKSSTVAPEIVQFAAGVRAALADLPAEEVEDLTEGLEADLAESLAEDLRRTLPDPVAYAAELRLAAGLPGPATDGRPKFLSGVADGWRGLRDDVRVAVRRNPALVGAIDFLGALRPAWWVVRAVIAVTSVRFLTGDRGDLRPNDLPDAAVLALAVLLSVQWGRGRWRFRGLGPVLLVGNLAAAVLLVPVLSVALRPDVVYVSDAAGYGEQDLTGVYLNGTAVTNIFGFDAKGRALKDIQLFDQDGNPLATAVAGANGCLDPECQGTGLWVPSALRNGTVAWNVFPMRMVEDVTAANGGLKAAPGAEPQDLDPPFTGVPALVSPEKVAKPNG